MSIGAIKEELSDVLEAVRSNDAATVATALIEYRGIVDLFHKEYESQMSPEQYKTSQREPEYFLRLLDLAESHRKTRLLRKCMYS